jgi:hypothetical protein
MHDLIVHANFLWGPSRKNDFSLVIGFSSNVLWILSVPIPKSDWLINYDNTACVSFSSASTTRIFVVPSLRRSCGVSSSFHLVKRKIVFTPRSRRARGLHHSNGFFFYLPNAIIVPLPVLLHRIRLHSVRWYRCRLWIHPLLVLHKQYHTLYYGADGSVPRRR